MSAYSQLQLVRIGMASVTVASTGCLVYFTRVGGLESLAWGHPKIAAGLFALGACVQFWAIFHYHLNPRAWAVIWTAVSYANCAVYFFADPSLFNFHGNRHQVEAFLVSFTAALTYKLVNGIIDKDGDFWPNIVCRDSPVKARSKAFFAIAVLIVGMVWALGPDQSIGE